ncbi:xanthine dehydrogenase accessory protein XdhC [Aestuariibacter halophilus]|uniref:Xanthine dehydrogenase accessory protein XdhC n=1 Tax=Fluctibacter halophilus TaxID=226011 RepID=A0ABS8G955_9ALTE|nr:xanthine dehydrogenase accessory protein XdhC [Aestuariibacter halophilus]MCC2615736.1 xanthine dehydrogenase accessory protein XdhC [Aestuariibacter halophilus]
MKATLSWQQAISQLSGQQLPYVLVTVLGTAGSTPRNSGSKMVITATTQHDTIGGGHLEHVAIQQARSMLGQSAAQQHIEHFPLSSKLGQCCGGAVSVLFEVIQQYQQPIAVFGAGHVAHALIPILTQLPLSIQWIDSRQDWLSDLEHAPNLRVHCSEHPQDHVSDLDNGTWVLVLTHNHQLDLEIVHQALKRNDLPYVGMIGSDTKAKRFNYQLAQRGLDPQQRARLISPVGLSNIPGKRPIEVAVSIAGQLIERLHHCPAAGAKGTSYRQSLATAQQINLPQETQ